MTTGSILRGSNASSYEFEKNWSGGDGKGATGGQLQWNDYSMTCKNFTHKIGVGQYKSSVGNIYPASYTGAPAVQNVAIWTSNDNLKLDAKLSDAARGHSFNLGVAIAESSETVALVYNTVVRFTKSIKFLRKGDIANAVRSLGVQPSKMHKKNQTRVPVSYRIDGFGHMVRSKDNIRRGIKDDGNFPVYQLRAGRRLNTKDVSGLWLEIQYGWKPLINDVYNGMEALSAHYNPPRKSRFSVSRTIKASQEKKSVGAYIWNNSESIVSRKIICELTETLSIPRSLGLADPRPILWERIPFSFVADWFIPIGSYLDSLAVIPFLVGRFCTIHFSRSYGFTWADGYPPNPYGYAKGEDAGSLISLTRTVSTTIVVPRPEFVPLPAALSPAHIKNAIALLHQLVI